MVTCEVCGLEYGLAHNCPGARTTLMSDEEAAPPPSGFAPFYYFRLAFNIARWDDVSIRRASRDPKATYYGVFLWVITALIILIYAALPQILVTTRASGPALIIGLAVGFAFGIVVMAVITFVQLGTCHLIAKGFFGGKGTLLGVMRPLLLGWFVNILVLVPVVGLLACAIAWIAVLMLVFEEVDGISRLQAFFISAGVNVCFTVLQFMMGMRH